MLYDAHKQFKFSAQLALPAPCIAGLLPARAQSCIRADIQAKIIPFTHKPIRRRDVVGIPSKIMPMPIPEAEKWLHASVLAKTLDKLAYCRNKTNHITTQGLFWLFEAHNWTCYLTKQRHSAKTPLTFEFKTPIEFGGTFHVSNLVPRYRAGWHPGEYYMLYRPDSHLMELAS